MMNQLKKYSPNFIKLAALNALMVGCVMRQPVVYKGESYRKDANGNVTTNTYTWAGNKEEFTIPGRIWNTGTFGTLGCIQGAFQESYKGFTHSNNTDFVQSIGQGCWGFIEGTGWGLYKGMKYGYNLNYDEGRSVEGKIFDTIDYTTDMLFQQMENSKRYIGN